ncbi:MAG: GspE/PulE family protein [Planctomycetaceae bacterium]
MSPLESLPPPGFLSHALTWLVVAGGWAGAAVWVERDARWRYGGSQPWKGLFMALGCGLAYPGVSSGIALVEAIGCLTGLALAAYATLTFVADDGSVGDGPAAVARRFLQDVKRMLRMAPAAVMAVGGGGGSGASVVLLRKDGGIYGGRDSGGVERDSSQAVATLKAVLADAIACRATDIHVEPRAAEIQVRFRVDGLLRPDRTIGHDTGRAVVSAVKVLADMDIAEHRLPQDGTFAVVAGQQRFEVRVGSIPGKYGEKLALRLLDPGGGVLRGGLGDLGFRDSVLEKVRGIVNRPNGMLIVCGPTGSGKTTTAYGAISEIDGLSRNIVTIEDPVEYQLENVSQTAVNQSAGLTFSSILRSVLRQDPDVILVGEIRDKETAEIAMQAALTGHFVFTTLHANDAPTTVARLIEIGIDATMIQSAVTAVLAQRLLRVLCPACREKYTPSPEEYRRYGIPEAKVKRLYRANPSGCDQCSGRGYSGRTAVYELMMMGSEVRQLLVGRPSEAAIREAAERQGMKSLRQEALHKAALGITSLDEIDRGVGEVGA